jgi:hypothetical protein
VRLDSSGGRLAVYLGKPLFLGFPLGLVAVVLAAVWLPLLVLTPVRAVAAVVA